MSLDEIPQRGNRDTDESSPIAELASPAPGVNLWWCPLDAPPHRLRELEAILSNVERSRAERFGTVALKFRYVIGRASLRIVLGRTLGLHPAAVRIVRGERGRPQLADASVLDFNVSHTAGMALIGVLQAGRIGVDVERVDRAINVAGIARKFLTATERLQLSAPDTDCARRDVLRLWTCKEAMSKATGDALSAPFASLDVNLRGGPELRNGPAPYEPAHWSLHAAAVPTRFFATIAIWNRPDRLANARNAG